MKWHSYLNCKIEITNSKDSKEKKIIENIENLVYENKKKNEIWYINNINEDTAIEKYNILAKRYFQIFYQ